MNLRPIVFLIVFSVSGFSSQVALSQGWEVGEKTDELTDEKVINVTATDTLGKALLVFRLKSKGEKCTNQELFVLTNGVVGDENVVYRVKEPYNDVSEDKLKRDTKLHKKKWSKSESLKALFAGYDWISIVPHFLFYKKFIFRYNQYAQGPVTLVFDLNADGKKINDLRKAGVLSPCQK